MKVHAPLCSVDCSKQAVSLTGRARSPSFVLSHLGKAFLMPHTHCAQAATLANQPSTRHAVVLLLYRDSDARPFRQRLRLPSDTFH